MFVEEIALSVWADANVIVDPEYSLIWTETTRKCKIHRSQKTWRASNTSRSEPNITTVIAFLAWCLPSLR